MTGKPTPPAEGEPATPSGDAVEIDVARTGGLAGLTRHWSAQPTGSEASEWIVLLDRCPWNSVAAADPVPDGFVWVIRASLTGAEPREAELSDDELTGAWRELVDAVRAWNTSRRAR